MLQCSLYKIPCFFTACVGNTPDKSEYIHAEDEGNARYINDAVCAGSRDIHLTDDQIKKHLCVVCGFDVVPSRKALEVDMEEIFTEEPADDIFLVSTKITKTSPRTFVPGAFLLSNKTRKRFFLLHTNSDILLSILRRVEITGISRKIGGNKLCQKI